MKKGNETIIKIMAKECVKECKITLYECKYCHEKRDNESTMVSHLVAIHKTDMLNEIDKWF